MDYNARMASAGHSSTNLEATARPTDQQPDGITSSKGLTSQVILEILGMILAVKSLQEGAVGMSLYGSSKAAINLLTKPWSAEYGPSGVRVNSVSPGPTRPEGTAAMDEGLEQLAAQAPAGRPATAEEIAEAIVFLATDRASFVQGAKLEDDGGRNAV